jgi:hypothetical protein
MYRRTGIALFLLFGTLAVLMLGKSVTYERGKSIDFDEGSVTPVITYCGDVFPILFDGVYDEGVPERAVSMRENCAKAARSHFAWIIIFTVAGFASLILGLIRGPAPKVWAIDKVLQRLPSPSEVGSGFREPSAAPNGTTEA